MRNPFTRRKNLKRVRENLVDIRYNLRTLSFHFTGEIDSLQEKSKEELIAYCELLETKNHELVMGILAAANNMANEIRTLQDL